MFGLVLRTRSVSRYKEKYVEDTYVRKENICRLEITDANSNNDADESKLMVDLTIFH